MSDSALTRALKKRYGTATEQPATVTTAESGQTTAAPSASGSALSRALKKRYGGQSVGAVPKGYYPQKSTVERVGTHLIDVKNGGAKKRYDTYQSNLRRIGEIDGILNSPYMKLKTSTGDRQEYDTLSAEKKKLEATNRVYESRYKPYDERYLKYAGAEGWSEAAANRNYNRPTEDNLYKYGTIDPTTNDWYTIDPAKVSLEDPLGTYMAAHNGEEGYGFGGKVVANPMGVPYTLPENKQRDNSDAAEYISRYNSNYRQGEENHWELLDDAEVDLYYGLLKTQGKDAAMAFLNDMAVELGRRYQGEQQSDLEDAGFWETVGHNLLSVPANVAGGIAAAPRDLLSLAKGEQINPYDKNHALMNYGQNVRGVTAGKIDEATGASDSDFITWGDTYQGLMSGVDSVVAGLTMGPTGAAIALGTNAGEAEAKELFEKGASQEEMMAGGLLAGAVEAVFEKVSIGYFLDDVLQKPSKNIAQSLMKTLGQAGVEASEEFCTTLGNYITDAAVRGSTSDFMTMVEDYEEQGLTHGEAVWETLKAIGGEALHSAAIGAISGFGMGAGGSVVSGFDKSETTSIQLQAKEKYPYDMTAVIQGYLDGVDKNVLKYVEQYRQDKTAKDERIFIGGVTNRQNKDLSRLLDANFEGYSFTAQKSAFNHIEIRHGINGEADSSMSRPEDVARIGYVLQNYDTVEITTDSDGNADYSKQYHNKDNSPAPLVKFKKKINGTYYAVIACPDAKWKRLWLVSAYIGNKKGDTVTQESNAFALDSTPEAGLASPNVSDNRVTQPDPVVNTHFMQGGENYSRTSTAPMGDVQVVERALQLTAEGKRKATAADFDGILQELGEEETLKRLYNSQQFDRPTGMVEIEGRRVDANAYADAYEQSLPDDPAALQETIRHLEKQRTAEVLQMEQEGTLKNYKPHRLKINLQLFAARRKWELLQLEPGEDGSKVRQFWEKRLKGNDEMHSEELLELMAGRTETYDPISNQETLAEARNKLNHTLDYRDKLIKKLNRTIFLGSWNRVDTAAAIELIRIAHNEGNYEVMMDLIAGLSRRGTEAGRAVQAFSMMARMTPEGVLKAAHRTLQKDADYVIGEGASEGLDELSKKLAKALEQLNRLKGLGNDTSSTASGPPSPQGEGRAVEDARLYGEGAVEDADVQVTEKEGNGQKVMVQVSRENVVGALAKDLAATEGTYLTREDIEANLEKVIKDATDVPEQVKRYVLKKLRKKDGGLAQRLYELHRKGHLTADATRRAMEQALELPTLTDEDVKTLVDMTTRVQELADDPVAQADAMEEIYDFLGAKMTVKRLDRLQAWRKFAMLANVKTHVRNMVSNGAYAGIRKANDLISMGLERMFRVPADQRGAYLGWSKTQHGQDIMPTLEKQADLAVLEMQKRGAKYETGAGQLKQHRKFFGTGKIGEFFNNLSGKNSEWLEREDIRFFKPAYIDALGQMMTARGETEITTDMHEKAMQRALEATFRADNAISDVLTKLKRYQNKSTVGQRLFGQAVDVVIPFSKTPANIAVQTVMHSPVGVVKGAFDLYNAVKGKGTKDAATAINTMAKGITGTTLTVIGFLLGSAGMFNSGFGKSEKERAADELAGRQENALIFGDTSITLDWLQPVAAPLIVGASIGQRMREDEISAASVFGAVMDGTDSLFELSMLQSLYDVLGGYDAGATATAASIGENVVSQSIPTLVGQAARSIDPVQRKTKGDSDFETIVNQVLAKIPGLTYLLDPELDVWGNEVYRTGKPSGGGTVLNAAQQFVLPSNTKTGTGAGDYVSEEILRLYEEYGNEVIPTAISRDDAKDKDLDYVEDNRTLGAVNRTAVEDFINDVWPYQVQETLPNGKTRTVTKFYSEMTDDERRRVLSRIYQKSKETVTGETEDTKTKSKQDRYFEQLFEEMR